MAGCSDCGSSGGGKKSLGSKQKANSSVNRPLSYTKNLNLFGQPKVKSSGLKFGSRR